MSYKPNKNPMIEQIKIVFGILILLAVIMVVTVVRTSSYNGAQHTNKEGGTVYLTVQNSQSKVAIDTIVEGTTLKDGELFVINHLDPREYEFATIHEGYIPWDKTFIPELHSSTNFHSFGVSVQPEREDIGKEDPRYNPLKDKFEALTIPDINSELISNDKQMGVWVEHNTVFAEWLGPNDKTPEFFCVGGICNTRIQIVNSVYNIRSVAFFEKRNDVIVFSDDNGIYAIELDKRGRQNFQPIYKILNPEFYMIGDRKMMVDSNTNYFTLSF